MSRSLSSYTLADLAVAVLPLGIIGFYRYLWYLIRFGAYLAYKPISVPEHPTYRAEEDVTVSTYSTTSVDQAE